MKDKHSREGLGIVGPSEEREKAPGEDFLTYDDRQVIWDLIAGSVGERRKLLSASELELRKKQVNNFTRKAIDEVIDMEGGAWDDLNPRERREALMDWILNHTPPSKANPERYKPMPDFIGKDTDFIATTEKKSGPDSIRVFEIFDGHDLKVIERNMPILLGDQWATADTRHRADLIALITKNLAEHIQNKKDPIWKKLSPEDQKKPISVIWSSLGHEARASTINMIMKRQYPKVL